MVLEKRDKLKTLKQQVLKQIMKHKNDPEGVWVYKICSEMFSKDKITSSEWNTKQTYISSIFKQLMNEGRIEFVQNIKVEGLAIPKKIYKVV